MLHSLTKALDSAVSFDDASAHCDIPCKIYDPVTALIAAQSVVRMMDILAEQEAKPEKDTIAYQNTVVRIIQEKEKEAEHVKHEIRVIWGDYIKAPQIEKFPGIHDLAHRIMLKASACKQHANRQDGLDLVELVNEFADIFWQTKDVKTKRQVSPYPPSLEVVVPDL